MHQIFTHFYWVKYNNIYSALENKTIKGSKFFFVDISYVSDWNWWYSRNEKPDTGLNILKVKLQLKNRAVNTLKFCELHKFCGNNFFCADRDLMSYISPEAVDKRRRAKIISEKRSDPPLLQDSLQEQFSELDWKSRKEQRESAMVELVDENLEVVSPNCSSWIYADTAFTRSSPVWMAA